MYMPKSKPDVVYVHRIEAGEWERQNILKPVADLSQTLQMLRTASFVVVGGATASAVWVAYIIGKKFVGWSESAGEMIEQGSDELRRAVKQSWLDPAKYFGSWFGLSENPY